MKDRDINSFITQLEQVKESALEYRDCEYSDSAESLKDELVRLIKNSATYLKQLGDN